MKQSSTSRTALNHTTKSAAPVKQATEAAAAEWEVWGWAELARMQTHYSADVLQPGSADSRYEAETDIEGDWGDSDEELEPETESEVETEDENVEDDEDDEDLDSLVVLDFTIPKERSAWDRAGGFHADLSHVRACDAASAMAVASFSP